MKCCECGYDYMDSYFAGRCMFCMKRVCTYCFDERGHNDGSCHSSLDKFTSE